MRIIIRLLLSTLKWHLFTSKWQAPSELRVTISHGSGPCQNTWNLGPLQQLMKATASHPQQKVWCSHSLHSTCCLSQDLHSNISCQELQILSLTGTYINNKKFYHTVHLVLIYINENNTSSASFIFLIFHTLMCIIRCLTIFLCLWIPLFFINIFSAFLCQLL